MLAAVSDVGKSRRGGSDGINYYPRGNYTGRDDYYSGRSDYYPRRGDYYTGRGDYISGSGDYTYGRGDYSWVPVGTEDSSNDALFELADELYAQRMEADLATADSILHLYWAVVGNVLSMLLNSVIAIVLMASKDLRTAQLFLILLQSILDFVTTGLVPCLANIVLIWVQTNHPNLYRLYFTTLGKPENSSNTVAADVRQMMCYVFLVCDAFVKGSTCLTVTAVAFLRFISVCYPFKLRELTNKNFYVKFFCGLIPSIFVLTTTDIIYKTVVRPNCMAFSYVISLGAEKGQTDYVSFFGFIGLVYVPLFLASCFFYVKVSLKLLNTERNAATNKGLTVAFVMNTILWAVCWGVSFVYKV